MNIELVAHLPREGAALFALKNSFTLCEFLLNDEVIYHNDQVVRVNDRYLHDTMKLNTGLIRKQVLDKLADADIHVGKKFGATGANKEQVLAEPDTTVFEINIRHLRLDKDVRVLKKLFTEHTVIVTDTTEVTFGYEMRLIENRYVSIYEYLMHHNIIPKKIILVQGSTTNINRPNIGLSSVNIPFFLLYQSIATPYIIQAIKCPKRRKDYLHLIEKEPYQHSVNFITHKHRPIRLMLLAELHAQGVLQNIDWSLPVGDSQVQVDNDIKKHTTYQDYFVYASKKLNNNFIEFHKSNITLEFRNHYAKMIAQFFTENELPKKPKYHKGNKLLDYEVTPKNCIRKHDWAIAVEPVQRFKTVMGTSAGVTEKTFKCFTQGSLPILLADSTVNRYLTTIGFKVPHFGHEEMPVLQKPAAVAKIVNDIVNSTRYQYLHQESVIHNAMQVTDLNFVVDLIAKPLMENLCRS